MAKTYNDKIRSMPRTLKVKVMPLQRLSGPHGAQLADLMKHADHNEQKKKEMKDRDLTCQTKKDRCIFFIKIDSELHYKQA